ncbi:MAG TPA: dihydrodipicolinate reductase C-terminal domain-containing protein, partial [Planctomycetota bacterium]|nr:dihydrodipicolinate reductase C-terminal domain-containing protein [Planctomycetota bacterium]
QGRMGRFVEGWLAGHAEFAIVTRVDSDQDLRSALRGSPARVGLDFTRAGLGASHGRILLEAGLSAVIGTSGMDPAQDAELETLALERSLGCWVVPNFSLASCVQQRLAEQVAAWFPEAVIQEEHGIAKHDVPSGTSLETRRRMEAVRGADAAPIPIQSLRLSGVVANQSVVLSGAGEVLRLVHETYDRSAYGPGLERVLREMATLVGFRRGLDALLGARE